MNQCPVIVTFITTTSSAMAKHQDPLEAIMYCIVLRCQGDAGSEGGQLS
jgi:hypothetical protein